MSQKKKNELLIKKYRSGSMEAAEELIIFNDRFIRKHLKSVIDKHMLSCRYDYDDALQDCRLALLDAAKTYEPSAGAFTTYATWKMFAAVSKGWDEGYLVHIPKNLIQSYRKEGELPDTVVGMISRFMNMPELGEESYLEESAGKNDPIFNEDLVADEKASDPYAQIELDETRKELYKAITALNIQEQVIVIRYYGLSGLEKETFEEISSHIGISSSRVHAVHKQAIKRLRRKLSQRRLLQYYEKGLPTPTPIDDDSALRTVYGVIMGNKCADCAHYSADTKKCAYLACKADEEREYLCRKWKARIT